MSLVVDWEDRQKFHLDGFDQHDDNFLSVTNPSHEKRWFQFRSLKLQDEEITVGGYPPRMFPIAPRTEVTLEHQITLWKTADHEDDFSERIIHKEGSVRLLIWRDNPLRSFFCEVQEIKCSFTLGPRLPSSFELRNDWFLDPRKQYPLVG